jgi:hypothetical protein
MSVKNQETQSPEKVLADAKKNIKMAIKQNGPYSHNIVSLSLNMVSKHLGAVSANSLVDEFKLDKKFGIYKVDLKD